MRTNWDKHLRRQRILNRLSSKEREEYERKWEKENKKEYDEFKQWQREEVERKQYWEIGGELFKLEDKAYSLYCQNRLQESFDCYKEIFCGAHIGYIFPCHHIIFTYAPFALASNLT